MRIYFIGSESSGKSTLCKYVSKNYNLLLIHEIARKVLYKQELCIDALRSEITCIDNYQQDIFNEQIAAEKQYSEYVSDRSIIDCLAYTGKHTRILHSMLNSEELNKYIDILKLKDSIIFFVRPSRATLKSDGVREILNWDSIIAVDATIKFLLEMFELRYFQINTDNMQERIRLIDSVISLIK